MDKQSSIGCDTHTTLNEAIADYFRATGHNYVPNRRFQEDHSYIAMNITPVSEWSGWPLEVKR